MKKRSGLRSPETPTGTALGATSQVPGNAPRQPSHQQEEGQPVRNTIPDDPHPGRAQRRRTVVEILALLLDFVRPTLGESRWAPWVRAALTLVLIVVLATVVFVVVHVVARLVWFVVMTL